MRLAPPSSKQELHHQGDVGEVSYAAVPPLVRIYEMRGIADWNTYAIVATIEVARLAGHNPTLPPSQQAAYQSAWRRLVTIGISELETAADPNLICCIIELLRLEKDNSVSAGSAIDFDEDERQEILDRVDGVI